MYNTVAKFLLFSLLLSFFVTLDGLPLNRKRCSPKSIATKRNNIGYYRKTFSFVKETSIGFGLPLGTIGSSVGTQNAGTTKCPWYWAEDTDSGRKPRALAVAKCPNCSSITCRPVSYTHQVLVQQCDQKTGEKVWVWKQKTSPIAFVFIG